MFKYLLIGVLFLGGCSGAKSIPSYADGFIFDLQKHYTLLAGGTITLNQYNMAETTESLSEKYNINLPNVRHMEITRTGDKQYYGIITTIDQKGNSQKHIIFSTTGKYWDFLGKEVQK